MLTIERQLNAEGFQWVIGVDEAGRGPLAGPVVAAAVALRATDFEAPIRDSKKLSCIQRSKAFCEIQQKAFFGFGVISEAVIDRVNILNATFLAMNTAVEQCLGQMSVCCPPGKNPQRRKDICLIIDGNCFRTSLDIAWRTLVEGDNKSLSIAAASILAKVTRDRILDAYDRVYPQYGFRHHKGYATLAHKAALRTHGESIIHRRSFRYQV
jgi:ribonuclease HII